jgi:SAM-dependent methyltransferase
VKRSGEFMPLDEPIGRFREEHEERYKWAASWTRHGDVVLDAACGTGYGRAFLRGDWIGVDRGEHAPKEAIRADLTTWSPDFDFDVFVGLETIEHLPEPEHYVAVAKRARHVIVVSTPIAPHRNRWHLRKFSIEEILHRFVDDEWEANAYHQQREMYGLFCFVHR